MPIWRVPPQPTQARPKVIESVDDPVGGRFDATKIIWAQPPQPQQRSVKKTLGIPIAITAAASNIGSATARINGKISDDGGESCEARFRWKQSNLLANLSFEIGDPPEDWECIGGTFARSDVHVKSGLYSGKIIANSEFDTELGQSLNIESVRNRTIAFGCWVWATDADRVFVAIGGEKMGSFNSDFHPGDGESHFLSVLCLIPEEAGSVICSIIVAYEEQVAIVYCDEAVIWTLTDWQNTLQTDDTYYEDLTDLIPGVEYEFQAQARNSAGEGEWSSSEYFTTLGGQPIMRRWGGSILPVGAQRIGKGW